MADITSVDTDGFSRLRFNATSHAANFTFNFADSVPNTLDSGTLSSGSTRIEGNPATQTYTIMVSEPTYTNATAVFHWDSGTRTISSLVITNGVHILAAPTEPVVTPPSAPTAPTKPYRFTQVFRGLNNHKKTIVALGTSANNAFAFLTAEAKIRGGTNITALTETIRFDHTAAPALGGSGATVDAVLDLYRVADNSSRQLTIPDMLASYLITGTKFVDSTNADIIAVGTAFEDEYGNTGYVVQVSSHSLN